MKQSLKILFVLFLTSTLAVPLDKLKKDKCLKCKKGEEEHRIFRRSADLFETGQHVNDIRLPREVAPIAYRLHLIPRLNENSFTGHIWINITCLEGTDTIVLNAYHNLNIFHKDTIVRKFVMDSDTKNAHIDHPMNIKHFPESASRLNIVSVRSDKEANFFNITLSEKLMKNHIYMIEAQFSGDMFSGKNEGLFVGNYVSHSTGERKWYAATHMRPTDARKIFPCFDEPINKVPFELSIAKPPKYTILSNMPEEEEDEEKEEAKKVVDHPGWYWQKFQRTPPLATYSFGFLISEFDNITSMDGDVRVNFYARSHFLSQLKEAAELTPKIIEFLESYLKMKFPLKKLDLVALPHYTGSDPIDLYGLILFRESDLIGDTKLWYLTQEIANQWVGHFTSPHWWNHALINTALANYLVNAFTMQWKNQYVWTQGYSLYYGYGDRHPFSNLGSQLENIKASKATWLLRMLNYTLTEETFRNGLKKFMDDRQYKTYSENDLWAALDAQGHKENTLPADISVSTISKSWLEKERLPVVTATRNYDDKTVEITQHTFLREHPADFPEKEQLLWYIPIMYITPDQRSSSQARPVAWLKNQKKITLSAMPDSDKFIIINPEEIGMFMVNYDTSNWAMLAEYLTNSGQGKAPQLSTAVRAKLLHDAWNLAYAGELNFVSALDMTLFLQYEREIRVWDVVFTMIDHLKRQTDGTKAGNLFVEYCCELVRSLLNSLDEEGKNSELGRLAKQVLSQISNEVYVKEAKDIYGQWMNSSEPDAGNPIGDTYLCTVFEWGNMEEWEFGLQRVINFPESRLKSERYYLLKTVAGCPKQEEKIQRLLNITLLEENSKFSDADLRLIFSMLTGGSAGYSVLFRTLVENWDFLKNKFESEPHMWEYLIASATECFKTNEGLDKITELYVSRQNEFGKAEAIIEQSLKKVKGEARWSEDNLPVMEGWLNDHRAKKVIEKAIKDEQKAE